MRSTRAAHVSGFFFRCFLNKMLHDNRFKKHTLTHRCVKRKMLHDNRQLNRAKKHTLTHRCCQMRIVLLLLEPTPVLLPVNPVIPLLCVVLQTGGAE